MALELNNFDEKLRSVFSDFEAKPPASVWYNIADRLPKPAFSKRMIPYLPRIAASVVFLLIGSLSLWYIQYRQVGQTNFTSRQQITVPPLNSSGSGPEVLPLEGSLQYTKKPLQTPILKEIEARVAGAPEPVLAISGGIKPIASLLARVTPHEPTLTPKLSVDFTAPPQAATLASTTFATVEKSSDFPLLAFGIQIGPQYSFRRLPELSFAGNSGIPFESLESYLISYSAGLIFDIQFSRRAGIRTGLNYSVSGQFIKDVFAFSNRENSPIFELPANQKFGHPQTIITSQGYIRLNDPSLFFSDAQSYRVLTNKQLLADGEPSNLMMRDFGISQYFSFVELPLLIYYKLFDMNQADLRLKTGGSINYLIENEVFLGKNSMQMSIGDTYGLRKFNLSVMGGVVLNIPLSNRLNLTFEPTAQIFIMPIVRNNLMIGKAIPFQYSFFSGLTYGF